MKFRLFRRPVALITLALLGGSLAVAPVGAQQAAVQDSAASADRSISLNLQNVPIQTALPTLFSSAGIRSYVIDPMCRASPISR